MGEDMNHPPVASPTTADQTAPLLDALQALFDVLLGFAVDFYLPSPVASSQPLRLPDGRWELGISIQMVMVKSSAQMVTCLQKWATYASFKAWLSLFEDWVSSHTHNMPDNLELATVCTMACLVMSLNVYSQLESCGTLGIM